MFRKNEQVDILIIYGQCIKKVARMYREEYPERPNHPASQEFYDFHILQ